MPPDTFNLMIALGLKLIPRADKVGSRFLVVFREKTGIGSGHLLAFDKDQGVRSIRHYRARGYNALMLTKDATTSTWAALPEFMMRLPHQDARRARRERAARKAALQAG